MAKFAVQKTPEERLKQRSTIIAGGCWNWNSLRPDGRANVFYYDGRYMAAYRASYLINKGPIPDGEQVCHDCDNPACVNPDHLWLGSQLANMGDMISKGRRASFKGSSHGQAKLTEKLARQIIDEYTNGGTTLKALASKFSVSVSTVHRVVLRKGWSHV